MAIRHQFLQLKPCRDGSAVDKCKKTNKHLKNDLNTGFYGDLPFAENVLFGGGDTEKPCIFMCISRSC
ncbi:hypothetical protein BVF91_07750 [Thermoanaerobacterium sp. PSU-2]|nr:hypothetical protein BVF91_07750 [Thermoanaerobacterium sp. PSU-2]